MFSMTKSTYAGNALATVKSSEKLKIITVRSTAFDKAKEGSNSAKVDTFDASDSIDKGTSLLQSLFPSLSPLLSPLQFLLFFPSFGKVSYTLYIFYRSKIEMDIQ